MNQGFRRGLLLCSFVCLLSPAYAQLGGRRAFQVLDLPTNARLASLGGVNVSAPTTDGTDPQVALNNPALLLSEHQGKLAFSYLNFVGDVRQNSLLYAFGAGKAGTLAAGLTYLNYGDFDGYDEAGNPTGTFAARDYAFTLSGAHQQGPFTLGASAKLAMASYAGNKSSALVADVGAVFQHPTRQFTVGLTMRNAGMQLSTFPGADREPVPFDVQLGLSFKPEHMPMRFSLAAHKLYQFDIVYLDPAAKGKLDENNNEIKPHTTVGDKIARHFVGGAELLLSKNFQLRAGYNYLRHRELRLENAGGGAGLSFGAMVKIGAFEFDFTRATYSAAGGGTYLTVISDLNRVFKKKAAASPDSGVTR